MQKAHFDKLELLFDQYHYAFKLQMQALRLLDALSDIDNGTNPRIIHARRRAFRRWDKRERIATRLHETWLNYRNSFSDSRYDLEKAALDRFNDQRLKQDSGDTFAATPACAPEIAKPEEVWSDSTSGAGQGQQPTAFNTCPFCGYSREFDSSYCFECNQYADPTNFGTCATCGESSRDLDQSRNCPDCAAVNAIQEQPSPPSSMYQCPRWNPFDGLFCDCDSCTPVVS